MLPLREQIVMPERYLTVETLSRTEDLRNANEDWIGLCAHPEAHPRFIEAACSGDETVIRPHVVLVRRAGVAVGLAVSRLERAPLPIEFGLATLAAPQVATLRLSYNGIVGAEDEDVWSLLWEGLSEPLRSGEAQAMFWDHITAGSSLDTFIASPPTGFIRDLSPAKPSTHWVLDTTGGYDAYVAGRSKMMRHNIKRATKGIGELGTRAEIRRYASIDDLATIMADSEAIARETFLRKMGVGFDCSLRSHAMTRAGLEIGAFRADILYVDDKPAAYWHVLQWRDTRFTTHTGYSPAFAKLSVGSYLLQRLVADSCADPNTICIDFGFGDAFYKKEAGTANWQESSRLVYARRVKAVGLNVLRGGVGYSAAYADQALSSLGARDKVKAFWRKRVSSRKTSDDA
jgi:hypothetical protein